MLLKGSVEMTVETESVSMSAGDSVIVGVREVHQMANVGDSEAEYIVFGVASGEGGQTIVVE